MTLNASARAYASAPGKTATVVALHCSGWHTGCQWLPLRAALGGRFNVIAPDCESGAAPRWDGERPFRATDEARGIIDIIDATGGSVHLVGHSYGVVALRIAVERPHRIASLSLYEPVIFSPVERLERGRPPSVRRRVAPWRWSLASTSCRAPTGWPRNCFTNTGMAPARFPARSPRCRPT